MRSFLAVLAFVAATASITGCSQGSRPQGQKPPAPSAAASTTQAAPKPIPPGPKLFVTNEVGGDITVIDVGTHEAVATIAVGKRPRGVRVSPDAAMVYVAVSGSPIGGPGVDESKLPAADKKADGIAEVETIAVG